MDGLEQQLSQFLSDPNSIKQLQGMISSLGLNGQQSGGSGSQQPALDPAQGMPDMSALAGMLGALGGGQTAAGYHGDGGKACPGAQPVEPGGRLHTPADGT